MKAVKSIQLSWIGGYDQDCKLNAHMRYLLRQKNYQNAGNQDLAVYSNISEDDIKAWTRMAREEMRRRKDSRVAGKIMWALPRPPILDHPHDEPYPERYFRQCVDVILNLISASWDVPKDQIKWVIHDSIGVSGLRNPHVHIIFPPRNNQGRKLRIGPKDLKKLHKMWELQLNHNGFEVKKRPKELRFGYIPSHHLHKDEKFLENYKEWLYYALQFDWMTRNAPSQVSPAKGKESQGLPTSQAPPSQVSPAKGKEGKEENPGLRGKESQGPPHSGFPSL